LGGGFWPGQEIPNFLLHHRGALGGAVRGGHSIAGGRPTRERERKRQDTATSILRKGVARQTEGAI